ncbi:MAG: HAD-IIIA family hydrolase [Alphaproteobacteria bacterium]|nr:HAD-IIIA family hydrolase [Alphaproteobacteria bacterium]
MTLIEPDGIWCDVRTPGFPAHRPALFLDRDGTLIELVDYLASPDKVCLIDAAVEAIRTANNAGVAVVVVTNQSGIGRGYYDWTAFEAVQTRLYELLMAADARIDAAYACPHPPPSAGGPAGSLYRKPAPGMFLRAGTDLALDLVKSRVAGDASADLAAGKAAGLSAGLLVETGYGDRDLVAARALADDRYDVAWADWS